MTKQGKKPSDQEIFKRENLPFKEEHVADFFPTVKQMDYTNKSASQVIQEAKQATAENQLERAYEIYSQGVNLLLSVSGAMFYEVAQCISKMANIQYKFRDCLQAIELQSKAIIIEEKVLGFDDPTLAYSYSNLALYYHACGHMQKSFQLMNRSIRIL